MDFIEFCEELLGRPLSSHEKNFANFMKHHPDAKLIHPRGRTRITLQERFDMLFALYISLMKEREEKEKTKYE